MIFTSDNWAGVHPQIMDAMVAANGGLAPAYGGDDVTARAKAKFNEIFEREVAVFFVTTGGAANGLALSQFVDPFGAILCHPAAHIQMDEAGLPAMYTGGATLLTTDICRDNMGKITLPKLNDAMIPYAEEMIHHAIPQAISMTQGTESGTVYTIAETKAICDFAHDQNMIVHMDGARIANALVAQNGVSLADITWRAGVDVMSFGGSKNGAMMAEAVVFFNPDQAKQFAWRQKRAGQVVSKARFLAAQWLGYFDNDLWLDMAKQANAKAAKLSQGLAAAGVNISVNTEINEVFAVIEEDLCAELRAAGGQFYDWIYPDDVAPDHPDHGKMKRFICSYETTDAQIDAFLAACG